MRLGTLLVLGSLLAAAPAAAQEQEQARPEGPPPTHVKRVHHFDRGPVELLLRNREQLGLTAEQVARLEAIDARMEERNRPLTEQLLEMRRAHRGDFHRREGRPTPEQREEMRRRMEQARPLMRQIRENNREAMREVGEILTEAQKTQLRGIIQERREEWREKHPGKHRGKHRRGERGGSHQHGERPSPGSRPG